MSIYRIELNADGFMTFSIKAEELIAKMGGRFKPRFNAKPCLNEWTKPNGYFFSEDGFIKVPDITCWAVGCLVLNQKAYDAIGKTISTYGEFLPVDCEHIPYYIFNALHVVSDDSINQAKSKQDIDLGVFMGVHSLSFYNEQLSNLHLFKTNYDKKVSLFCTESFKALVEENKLQGLVFNKKLTV